MGQSPSSDSGGLVHSFEVGGNNYPIKGGKITDWQGGVRMNAFVSGGYLPESMRGQKTKGYIHVDDWYICYSDLFSYEAY